MSTYKRVLILAGVGLSAIAVGTLVYLLDRDPTLVPFFAEFSLYGLIPPVFGTQGFSLPTFTHAFALSLLTVALLGSRGMAALYVCCSWLAIDLVFETAQHPMIATRIGAAIDAGPTWMSVLEPVYRYTSYGTYDPLDMLSIVLGAGLAFAVIQIVSGSFNEYQNE